MSAEYQHTETKKPTSGPKKGQGKRKRPAKPIGTRNALYALAAEFKRRHPQATALDAWQHFVSVAEIGGSAVIVSHDPAADTLSYRPDIEKVAVRQLRRRSFEQRWYQLTA